MTGSRSGGSVPRRGAATWPGDGFCLVRGYGMALAHVTKDGSSVNEEHVGVTGTHRAASSELWLDGIGARG